MSDSGKGACGKRLLCNHLCEVRAGQGHVCNCGKTWKLDLGCGHVSTGPCTRPLPLKCEANCFKVLGCGHRCEKGCGNYPCACFQCVRSKALNSEPVPGTPKPALQKQLPSISMAALEQHLPGPSKAVLKLQLPGTSKAALQQQHPGTSKAAWQQQLPGTFKAARQQQLPGTSKAARQQQIPGIYKAAREQQLLGPSKPERQEMVPGPWMDSIEQAFTSRPSPVLTEPSSDLPDATWDSLREILSEAELAEARSINQALHFSQCWNEHLFPYGITRCPECGGQALGPTVLVVQRRRESGLEDDTAWRLGLLRCPNGHYYDSGVPACPDCGAPSQFYFPDP